MNTADCISAIQALILLLGLGFTGYQILVANRIAGRDTIQKIDEMSRTLVFRIVDDEALRPILFGANVEEWKVTGYRRTVMVKSLINFYALVYDTYKLHCIPENVWSTYKIDMKEFFQRIDSSVWNQVKGYHDASFVKYVDDLTKKNR
jgi:hypothetical protein